VRVRTITQRELRNGSAAIMDAVERGETFRITRRGVALAELRPVPDEAFTPVAGLKRAFAGIPTGDHRKVRAEADTVFGEDRVGG
jgi:antitoxin (DNA-binding transcriptional repressor) of toxin-antitoxin stability system